MTSGDYLRRVGSALGDLPWLQRRELLAELRVHLADFPAGTDLEGRLGTPEQYAADLRSAEGLERRRGPIAFLRARRPRNVVLTVVALAVVGLAAGAVAWAQSYQPLSWAGAGIYPPGLTYAPNGAQHPLVFHKGGRLRFGIPIENTGSFGVRIDGLGALAATQNATVPHPPLPFTFRLRMARPTKNSAPRSQVFLPFHPFDLEPGEESMLVIEATFANTCRPWQPGDVTDIEPRGYLFREGFVPIRFHFLWKTSTALVYPAFQLRIRFPKGCR